MLAGARASAQGPRKLFLGDTSFARPEKNSSPAGFRFLPCRVRTSPALPGVQGTQKKGAIQMPRTATRTRARRANPPQSEALLSFCRHCETIFEPASSPIQDVCPSCAETRYAQCDHCDSYHLTEEMLTTSEPHAPAEAAPTNSLTHAASAANSTRPSSIRQRPRTTDAPSATSASLASRDATAAGSCSARATRARPRAGATAGPAPPTTTGSPSSPTTSSPHRYSATRPIRSRPASTWAWSSR